MEFFADLHCHTNFSDGRNSVDEMIQAAYQKGLAKLAITDHGPNNIGTGVTSYEAYYEIKADISESMAVIKENGEEEKNRLEVLLGAEADVIDLDGKIDVPQKMLKQLDWLIIGLHPYIWPASFQAFTKLFVGNQMAKVSQRVKESLRNSNTKALVASLYSNRPDCVSHPNLMMAVDLEEVAHACVRTDTLFEINTGHQFQQVEEIRLVAKKGVNFVVNSDSHFTSTVGELAWGGELLTKAGVDDEQVYNTIRH